MPQQLIINIQLIFYIIIIYSMKILIVPMAAMAETAGSFSRAAILADALKKAGAGAALCAAMDRNYRHIDGLKSYPLSVPSPLGAPAFIARHTFPAARKLGISSRKTVSSFEEVLFLTGNNNYRYFRKSVGEIRAAIREYSPDAVYSEFSLSAIAAAKLENKPLYITASFPTQASCASSPSFSGGVRKALKEYGLPAADSCLEMFGWADKSFVFSIPELEPFEDKDHIFCGTLKRPDTPENSGLCRGRDIILVYMGSGTVSAKKALREVTDAFSRPGFEKYHIYISGAELPERSFSSAGGAVFHTAPRFDFGKLLPRAALYINHGGQNSVADGLIYGVPMLICPGKVFERKYNSAGIVRLGAGAEIPYDRFSAGTIYESAIKLIGDGAYRKNASQLGGRLLSFGGADTILAALSDRFTV